MVKNTVSPSEEVTREQAGKICDLLTAELLKSGLKRKLLQAVIQKLGRALTNDLVVVVRSYTKMVEEPIVRNVKVNRKRTPMQALNALGCEQHIDRDVVNSMPQGEGETVEITFFKVGRRINNDNELKNEYKSRGLKPVDPYSLAAANEVDPDFADTHPNGTHWENGNGRWYCASFLKVSGQRYLNVHSSGNSWGDDWWFGGIRE